MELSEEKIERYSRQLLLREVGIEGQKRLLCSKVLVIGAGALGSSALMYLAAAGVGTVGVADYDRVELSNLHRQIIHRTESIGQSKALSAKQTAKAINPGIDIRAYCTRITPDNIQEIIGEYDFIIDCTDRFESKFLINDACVLSKKAYSHAGVVRFEGQVMTYVPGQGPCLRCLIGGVPPRDGVFYCSEVGVLGSVAGILGSIQALEAIKYLLGIGELLVGRVIHIDALTMRIRTVQAPNANAGCRVCGSAPDITSLDKNRDEYVCQT